MNDMPKFEKARKMLSKKICSNCHYVIQDVSAMFCLFRKLHTEDGLFKNCHCFLPKTVFDHITESLEVLASEFVEMMYDRVEGDYRYYSMLTGEFYNSREEAVTATVEKLKEVES